MRVAVPSDNPGGLEAGRSDHFGHCDVFTLIEVAEDNTVGAVTTIANGDHQAGGCMVPVNVLQAAGAQAIIVGGMGARPMRGFADAGIHVYFADRAAMQTVGDVIKGYMEKRLPLMHAEQVCKGSGNCHH